MTSAVELEAFKARVDKLVRELRGSERMPGVDRIWLPGEQSHGKREAYGRGGVPLPAALAEDLDRLAERLGIEPIERLPEPPGPA